jgi:hypothetical protein
VIFEMNRSALALKLHPARVMKMTLAVAAFYVATCASVHAYTPKYRPRISSIDRQTDFSKVKTYAWLDSHLVADADLHAHIVAAVDRELGALGMTKDVSGSSDVVVTYAAYGRTDVKVNAKKIAKNVKPSYAVGILVVSVLAPKTMKTVLELRADTPVDTAARTASVDATVAAMFTLYPRRRY